jgi:hypothetical protein
LKLKPQKIAVWSFVHASNPLPELISIGEPILDRLQAGNDLLGTNYLLFSLLA